MNEYPTFSAADRKSGKAFFMLLFFRTKGVGNEETGIFGREIISTGESKRQNAAIAGGLFLAFVTLQRALVACQKRALSIATCRNHACLCPHAFTKRRLAASAAQVGDVLSFRCQWQISALKHHHRNQNVRRRNRPADRHVPIRRLEMHPCRWRQRF